MVDCVVVTVMLLVLTLLLLETVVAVEVGTGVAIEVLIWDVWLPIAGVVALNWPAAG